MTTRSPTRTTCRRNPIPDSRTTYLDATDADLVTAIGRGELEGLAEAYERHGRRVFSTAMQVCGSELAAAATQAAFMCLWRTPLVFDSSRGSLRTCLVAHAKARAVVLLRAANARRTAEGTSSRALAVRTA